MLALPILKGRFLYSSPRVKRVGFCVEKRVELQSFEPRTSAEFPASTRGGRASGETPALEATRRLGTSSGTGRCRRLACAWDAMQRGAEEAL